MHNSLMKRIIKFLFDKLGSGARYWSEENGFIRIGYIKGHMPGIDINKDAVCFVSGDEAYDFEHVYSTKTGEYLGVLEEFSINYDSGDYWAYLYTDTSLDNTLLYYIENGVFKKVKEFNVDIDFDNFYKNKSNPDKIKVMWSDDNKYVKRYLYPNGAIKRK